MGWVSVGVNYMDYNFEMHSLRREILQQLADGSRNCSSRHELNSLKHQLQRYIRRNCEPKQKSRSEVASEFGTIFDNAVDIVTGRKEIAIEDMPAILDDHDGAIESSEIDGDAVEVIESYSSNMYPVVQHPSGFRVCTCPSQKYQLVCKHTVARIIERNWRGTPASSPV